MDFEIFIESLFKLLTDGDNAFFVIYAVATCLLTQVLKKLFVNKVKVDVLHKFDAAVLIPFVLGAVFAVVDVFAVKGVRTFDCKIALNLLVNAATIGALATALFKLVSSLSGKSLNSMMKDDVFGMFYTQLLYYGNVRRQLTDKTASMSDFVAQVKLLAANAKSIYSADASEDDKRQRLTELLSGIIDSDSIATCVNALNKALINLTDKSKSNGQNKT